MKHEEGRTNILHERLHVAAIEIGVFVLKDNSILDEEEYLLKIVVETLQPTVQVEKPKDLD